MPGKHPSRLRHLPGGHHINEHKPLIAIRPNQMSDGHLRKAPDARPCLLLPCMDGLVLTGTHHSAFGVKNLKAPLVAVTSHLHKSVRARVMRKHRTIVHIGAGRNQFS